MPSNDDVNEAYKEDPRIPCQYGVKCYQKNAAHHNKYKHPAKDQESRMLGEKVITGSKRKNSDVENEVDTLAKSPPAKCKKDDTQFTETVHHSMSPSPERDGSSSAAEKVDSISLCQSNAQKESKWKDASSLTSDVRQNILDKFSVEMPDEFYKFFEFCSTLLPEDPCSAFKGVDLVLVGPYDVLNGKLDGTGVDDKKIYLRHWRYYYDPPEFQTILKGSDKDGLHFGYWRDTVAGKPIFVAKNSANVDCKITPVAENVFGAADVHMEEKARFASPFEKPKIANLHRRLKRFAKEHGISLERRSAEMATREKKVVARTLHGAGIVVPYDKKTQLGYRPSIVTNNDLKKILKRIDEATDDDERMSPLADLEEVIRLTTIAADECDFGNCLELGHDLFSSGIVHVQNMAVQMLAIAYEHLDRKFFLDILKAHVENRKKGCDLSIV